jgi:hypothetical protein
MVVGITNAHGDFFLLRFWLQAVLNAANSVLNPAAGFFSDALALQLAIARGFANGFLHGARGLFDGAFNAISIHYASP